jgi:hypothetical protein
LNRLAGAGGFEPPHGGTKIRCLTAWLRPNMNWLQRPTYMVLRWGASAGPQREHGGNIARLLPTCTRQFCTRQLTLCSPRPASPVRKRSAVRSLICGHASMRSMRRRGVPALPEWRLVEFEFCCVVCAPIKLHANRAAAVGTPAPPGGRVATRQLVCTRMLCAGARCQCGRCGMQRPSIVPASQFARSR